MKSLKDIVKESLYETPLSDSANSFLTTFVKHLKECGFDEVGNISLEDTNKIYSVTKNNVPKETYKNSSKETIYVEDKMITVKWGVNHNELHINSIHNNDCKNYVIIKYTINDNLVTSLDIEPESVNSKNYGLYMCTDELMDMLKKIVSSKE